jgi:hypothetical protein
LLLLPAGLLEAQAPAVPNITVDVREVLVPVVVTGTRGHHITNLRRSDFKVLEGGVPQDIVGFSTALSRQETGSNGGSIEAQGRSRGYLICIDTLHSSFASFTRVRDAVLAGYWAAKR